MRLRSKLQLCADSLIWEGRGTDVLKFGGSGPWTHTPITGCSNRVRARAREITGRRSMMELDAAGPERTEAEKRRVISPPGRISERATQILPQDYGSAEPAAARI